MKTAIITGITGQDGSYLSELLLKKNYEVHGFIRRETAKVNPDIEYHFVDLNNSEEIARIIRELKPDEIYNLAAQSHVGTSFDTPELTGNITGLGIVRILEAVRRGHATTRVYQASSSEMFGSAPAPQNELTPLIPLSPYAAAKVYAHHMCRIYRESYGLHVSCGILFNHETIISSMPLFVKQMGEPGFDIKPISDIVKFDQTQKQYQSKEVFGLRVWGKCGWTDVTYASAYPHDRINDHKNPRIINARNGAVMATGSHVVFLENGVEKKMEDIDVGEKIAPVVFPKENDQATPLDCATTTDEAELLGMLVADGSITYRKKGIGVHGKFIKTNQELKNRFSYLFNKITGGTTKYQDSRSGFNHDKIVGQLQLRGANDWLRSIDIYTSDHKKRVPKRILNATKEVKLAFLSGYNLCDGLKKNSCTYEFKNFKTNSATLALGLWYLISTTTKQTINLTVERNDKGRIFYSMNLLSPIDRGSKEEIVKQYLSEGKSQREISRITGITRVFIRKIANGGHADLIHCKKKEDSEIKKIIEMPDYDGWFYDLTTNTGEFHCGVGLMNVHNSPRRGENFVTRKITKAIGRIKRGEQDVLYLGNLDAIRDWGYAPEYVEVMWKMLQQDKPDDYVIGTGEAHSVRDFLGAAFDYAGLSVFDHVKTTVGEKRPNDVPKLRADCTKARDKLGWNPKVKFNELVKIMVDADAV